MIYLKKHLRPNGKGAFLSTSLVLLEEELDVH
jgi:hypothetical protein